VNNGRVSPDLNHIAEWQKEKEIQSSCQQMIPGKKNNLMRKSRKHVKLDSRIRFLSTPPTTPGWACGRSIETISR
jgi:hypothetical protein